MPGNIHISNSNLGGNFAIGSNAKSTSRGSQSVQGQNSTVSFERLSEELISHGVLNDEIAELRDAIERDKTSREVARHKIGSNVGSWMRKMFGKAVDTSWQVEISAAGSILASAIQRYYGWS